MRRLLALSLVIIAAGTGCRMCACPYDYCGPVVDDCCCGGGGSCGCGGGGYQGPAHEAYSDQDQYQEMQNAPSGAPQFEQRPYYEGARPMPPRASATSPQSMPFMATPALPRQAKKPSKRSWF